MLWRSGGAARSLLTTVRLAISMGLGLAACICVAYGQPAERLLRFDAASVKQSDPNSFGVATTRLPTKVEYVNWDLRHLLLEAFDIRDYQLEGPGWMSSSDLLVHSGKYVVRAIFPAGTSKRQVQLMLQSLLSERFQLKVHTEKKEISVYVLLVGPDGPKLKNLDPHGQGGITHGNRGKIEGSHVFMRDLADLLSRQMDRPVVDMTQIEGTADIALEWSPQDLSSESSDTGDSVFVAIRNQLGLQLVSRKAPMDVVFVDHAEKVPLES